MDKDQLSRDGQSRRMTQSPTPSESGYEVVMGTEPVDSGDGAKIKTGEVAELQKGINQMKLDKKLEGQTNKEPINILLLGKTGIGKSTLVNSMLNYAKYPTFEEALKQIEGANVPHCIPSLFAINEINDKGKYGKVYVPLGEQGECQEEGKSQTQTTKSYFLPSPDGKRNIFAIDTPGISDTEGVAKDNANFSDILNFIDGVEKLHGICILLKNDENRLDPPFVYCLEGVLTYLHKSAAKNIVFLFTHSSPFFKAGNTIGLLETLLKPIEEKTGMSIPVDASTTYFFDNCAFQALCAIKKGAVPYTEREMHNFSGCWEESAKTYQRLSNYLANRPPHMTSETLSLNTVRCTIMDLMPLLAQISVDIETSRMNIDSLKQTIHTGEKRAEVTYDAVESRPLEHGRTVCTAKRCISVAKTVEGDVIVHKECHKPCRSNGDGMPNAALRNCSMFKTTHRFLWILWQYTNPGDTCRECGCSWEVHMHERCEQIVVKNVLDEALIAQIRKEKGDLSEEEALNEQMREEQKTLLSAAANMVKYLKSWALKQYEDNMVKYNDISIQVAESEVAKHEGKPDYEDKKQKLLTIQKARVHYMEAKEFMEKLDKEKEIAVAAADGKNASIGTGDSEKATKDAMELIESLFKLKIFGKHIKQNFETERKAKKDQQQKQSHSEKSEEKESNQGWSLQLKQKAQQAVDWLGDKLTKKPGNYADGGKNGDDD